MHPYREYQPVPTFDYSSTFSYRSVYDNEFDNQTENHTSTDNKNYYKKSSIDLFIYNSLVVLTYLFVLITFPISSLFCIKKISSLQRCLIHRLGVRLPLKGPGYILKLPFIDHLSLVEIYEQQFLILNQDEQFLTSDGSIVQARQCYATLQVIDAILTKTSLNKTVDVKNCLKLRLCNLLRSKHVEDLERKIDFIVHAYEDDTNRFLKKWGYAIKLQQRPSFVVLERADPMSTIKRQIENILNPESSSSNNPLENFLNLAPKNEANHSNTQSECVIPLTEDEIKMGKTILIDIIRNYKQYLMFYSELSVQFSIIGSIDHYYSYDLSNNSILKLDYKPLKVDLSINFDDCNRYRSFLQSRDMSLINYKLFN